MWAATNVEATRTILRLDTRSYVLNLRALKSLRRIHALWRPRVSGEPRGIYLGAHVTWQLVEAGLITLHSLELTYTRPVRGSIRRVISAAVSRYYQETPIYPLFVYYNYYISPNHETITNPKRNYVEVSR